MKCAIDIQIENLEKQLSEAKAKKAIHDTFVDELQDFAKQLLPSLHMLYTSLVELKHGDFRIEIKTLDLDDRTPKQAFKPATLSSLNNVGYIKNLTYIEDKEDLITFLDSDENIDNIERLHEICDIIFEQSQLKGFQPPQDSNFHLYINQKLINIYIDGFKNDVYCKLSIIVKPDKNTFKIFVD